MPQRFLRPAITNSQRWNSVPFDTQSLYVRLLTLVDDYGRYDGRTAVIWGQCFSIWNELHPQESIDLQQLDRMLQQLAATSLIEIYESEGKKVLQLTQWQEKAREGTKSKWPLPCKLPQVAATPVSPSPSPSPSSTPSPAPSGDVREVELPIGFPKTEAEAMAHADFVGCTKELAAKVYQRALARGGRDSKDIPIRNWRAHLKTAATYDREFKANQDAPQTPPAALTLRDFA